MRRTRRKTEALNGTRRDRPASRKPNAPSVSLRATCGASQGAAVVWGERYFFPLGYIGVELAVMRMARALTPEAWDEARIPEMERVFWDWSHPSRMRIGMGQLRPLLFYSLPDALWLGADERVSSIEHAKTELRRHLHAGRLTATYLAASGEFVPVQPEAWALPNIVALIHNPVVDLETSGGRQYQRPMLINEGELSALISDIAPLGVVGAPLPASGRRFPRAAAVQHAASILLADKTATRMKVFKSVCSAVGPISEAYFKGNIWPDARECAGLPRQAKAGRPRTPKSS